jgi:spore coat protein B
MDKESLDLLVGRSIRVDRGGPESKMGKLLAVKDDHLVVYSEDEGMIYYKTDHIKSLSLDTQDFSDVVEDPNAAQPNIPDHIDLDDFTSVLKNMQFHWVQINRGGPEKIEGVLISATDTEVTVIVGNEVIKILPFHIRSISYGMKRKNEQEKDNNKDDKNGNKDNNNKTKNK